LEFSRDWKEHPKDLTNKSPQGRISGFQSPKEGFPAYLRKPSIIRKVIISLREMPLVDPTWTRYLQRFRVKRGENLPASKVCPGV